MKKLHSVTIGVPAHNEVETIAVLLEDLAKQKTHSYSLQSIIVVSDGSTDGTSKVVRSSRNKKLMLLVNSSRRGLAFAQNQIISQTSSDILILLNADIRVKDPLFVERLISPIIQGNADLTSPLLMPEPPRTFFESILETGSALKQILYETWRKGQHGYHCQGPARAFSRPLYKKLRFVENEGEDMYSYLACIQYGYKFTYVRTTTAFFRNPSTLHDHFKQSTRFFTYQLVLSRSLDREFVDREVKIPFRTYRAAVIKAVPLVVRSPIKVFCYIAIVVTMFSLSLLRIKPADFWGASTTKAI